ncbi:P-loop ATPase, Sll1717 family [Hyphococcus sp.]|uniref:P-loop ATPase, Sll1717 family n=1 Tax=Hyphococcus sp. TaxID=2038636 RepID=UPI0035C7825C
MPTPWVEDAFQYKEIKDLSGSSILKTSDVSSFLARDSARTVVAGPKGSGKTLLIKFKRKSLENLGYKLLPENQLLDVAPGKPLAFDDGQLDYIRQHKEFWSILWQIAICIAVIKAHNINENERFDSPLRNILENPYLKTPFQIFANLLHSTPQLFFASMQDFNAIALPIFATVHAQTAVFIDNIDEFFDQHLEHKGRHTIHGQMIHDFWHHAQIGLLLAVRSLSAQNPHVKIFTSIRIEAYNTCKEQLVDLANLKPYILFLRFDKDDLRRIFEQNISIERASQLVEPKSENLLARLFGSDNLHIRHTYTGRLEPIFDYVLRHTRGRPRDLMTLGSHVAHVPAEMRNTQTIRDAVNEAAAELGQTFLVESRPHYRWFDEDMLFNLIKSNVISNEQVRKLVRHYDESCPNEYRHSDSPGDAALGDLYECGLIGLPMPRPTTPGMLQHFESVYDISGNATKRANYLPDAKYYLIHPILGSYLLRSGAPVRDSVDSLNIINPLSDWIEDDGMRYVLQADVCDYTRIMENPTLKEAFRKSFEGIISRARDGIAYWEPVGGDGFLLADRSGYLVMRAAAQIAKEMRNSIFNAELRFGMDYGLLRIEEDIETGEKVLSNDIPLQRSRRLQEASAPGQLLLPSYALTALQSYEIDLPIQQVDGEEKMEIEKVNDGWRVSKAKDNFVVDSLYRVPLHEIAPEAFFK